MKKWSLYLIIVIIVVLTGVVVGWNIRKVTHICLVPAVDTLYVRDTVEHIIKDTVPYYTQVLDTIHYVDTILLKIDTNAVIKDYYAKHAYIRKWENDSIKITLKDTLTQNKYLHNELKYNIKVPFTTIINKNETNILYNKYFYGGINLPIKDFKYLEVEMIYTGPKMYGGIGYTYELKSINAKLGVKIIQFKSKK